MLEECEYLLKTSSGLSFNDFLEDESLKRAFVEEIPSLEEKIRRILDKEGEV